jgi:ABC-type antimicrobial peptide transport system permease subunit
MKKHPPKIPFRFFRWYCHPKLRDSIEGDLMELYDERLNETGKRTADRKFIIDVLLLFRPGIIRPAEGSYNLTTHGMYKSYLKIGWRNLIRNKGYSFINIAGLTSGMSVAILIGLWIWDELSFDKYHENYDRIAQVWQHNTANGTVSSDIAMPWVTSEEIRNNFGSDFKYVVQSTWTESNTLTFGEIKFNKRGNFIEPQATEMLSLKMLKGTRDGLKDPHSILLSASVAKIFFGDSDPLNQMMRVGRKTDVKVTGVYEDLPSNTSFKNVEYMLPWELWVSINPWLKQMEDPWSGNFTQTFVQLTDQADFNVVSEKIKNMKLNKVKDASDRNQKPEVFLHPMSKWHLYSEFKNGKNTGGRIQFIWLFGTIGVFVLLLACINFMNLSTARSEKRAKEVGIRKSMGSHKVQLLTQFFSESLLLATAAFLLALILAQVLLPFFNEVSGKKLELPWGNSFFWLSAVGFTLLTGLIAGSYPAIFLSSFQPVKVLKGAFHSGSGASLPRKILVVLQFSISTLLTIGTIIVYQQVQFARNRSVGYDKSGLIMVNMYNNEIHNHFEAVRSELIGSGSIVEMAESGSALTSVNNNNSGFDWAGKDPGLSVEFANTDVSLDFGKTVGWKIKSGRDFSLEFKSDSAAFIINEAAAKYIGFKESIGETLIWNGNPYKIIGVVDDVVMESPYQPVRPSLFRLTYDASNVVFLRLNPAMNTSEALTNVETIFKKHNTLSPFEYQFVDQEYEKKFGDEKRIGELSSIFAGLAIFISCLGIFGLASFMAEQRTKEIGVRKVMGASVLSLWRMLSRDFVVLVMISLIIAIPISYISMNIWLEKYEYRTEIEWWVFVVSGAGALLITLITVSYQSIRAAQANPVESLRAE